MTFLFLILIAIISIAVVIFIGRMTQKFLSPKYITAPKKPKIIAPATAPISEQTKLEIAAVKAKLEKAALPYSEAIIGSEPAKDPEDSRLGGPVYLPKNTEWPCASNGDKLLFLAQINFAQMPKIPDFPETGIVQIFIADDDLFGADFDHPERSQTKIFYHKTLDSSAKRHKNLPYPFVKPENSTESMTPFQSEAVHKEGRVISFDATIKKMEPDLTHWKYEKIADGIQDEEAIEKLWDELSLSRPEHYIGGHISLTQSDFRYNPPYSKYDRILLQLGWDENIMWGDAGEMSLSIRRDDLINKRFEKTIFWWDCS